MNRSPFQQKIHLFEDKTEEYNQNMSTHTHNMHSNTHAYYTHARKEGPLIFCLHPWRGEPGPQQQRPGPLGVSGGPLSKQAVFREFREMCS